MKKNDLRKRFTQGRKIERCDFGVPSSNWSYAGDEDFNLIKLLAGTWTSEAQGWNLIALPAGKPNQFRLLMNQYGEKLTFNIADRGVPNRGVLKDANGEADQLIDAISYEQLIVQKESADFPPSQLRSKNGDGIHHEPGFFLQFLNHIPTGHTEEEGEPDGPEEKLSIARLATIPHGNSVLAMGTVEQILGAPSIPAEDASPERINADFNNNPYMLPYKHFEDSPFFGTVPTSVPGFPGLSPKNANAILQFANPGSRVKRTTVLNFDTKFRNEQLTDIPISNIPFVTREADTTEMHATFWIMELNKNNPYEPSEFIMQYSQTVYLEFFCSDEPGKRIRWPHISINTLKKSL